MHGQSGWQHQPSIGHGVNDGLEMSHIVDVQRFRQPA